jgi:hypothetical protein
VEPKTGLTVNSNRDIARRVVVEERSDDPSHARNYSVARLHARRNRFGFKQHRRVRDTQITIPFDGNSDSSDNVRISRGPTEPGRSGLTSDQIQKRQQLRTKATRNMKVARTQAKPAASYANNDTVASSGLGRIPYKDVHAKTLARSASISKAISESRISHICKMMQNLKL